MDNLEVPSKVTERKYIRMPRLEKVVDDDEEWKRCGKWIWYNEGNPTVLDQVWIKLQPLLRDGTLIMIKASTAAMTEDHGAILCYTRPEKEAIRQAAKRILTAIKDDHEIYYKVNQVTENNISRRNNHENVSKYSCTREGRFYRRDHLHHWILDEEREPENHLPDTCIKEHKSTELLPSTTSYAKQDLKHPEFFLKPGLTGWWNIVCDNSVIDVNGCTEADRVWAEATSLFELHTFQRITYTKIAQITYIACYVIRFSDIVALTDCARKIIENAQYSKRVYFYVYSGSMKKLRWRYKLTAEGELYEMAPIEGFDSFTSKLILQIK